MYENYLSNLEKWEAQNYYMLKAGRANIATTGRPLITTPATPKQAVQTTSAPTTTPIMKVSTIYYIIYLLICLYLFSISFDLTIGLCKSSSDQGKNIVSKYFFLHQCFQHRFPILTLFIHIFIILRLKYNHLMKSLFSMCRPIKQAMKKSSGGCHQSSFQSL